MLESALKIPVWCVWWGFTYHFIFCIQISKRLRILREISIRDFWQFAILKSVNITFLLGPWSLLAETLQKPWRDIALNYPRSSGFNSIGGASNNFFCERKFGAPRSLNIVDITFLLGPPSLFAVNLQEVLQGSFEYKSRSSGLDFICGPSNNYFSDRKFGAPLQLIE